MKTVSALRLPFLASVAWWFATCLPLSRWLYSSTPEQVSAARAALTGSEGFARQLASAALDRTQCQVTYDAAYVKIPYPGGDVAASTGVCTDEVVRSYRALGYDLQKLVHEDMAKAFSAYPQQWGLHAPDSNIDHRRVPNLQMFFKRQGASLPVTQDAGDYKPGDVITCLVPGNRPHICLVVPSAVGGERPWIIHNIGLGPQLEDRLFDFPLTGHYRWHPKK